MSEEKSFLVVFVGGPDGDGHLFLGVPSSPLCSIREKVLSFMISCFVIRVLGLGVFFGMGGYLHLLALVGLPLGLLRLMMLLVPGWRDCSFLMLRVFVKRVGSF